MKETKNTLAPIRVLLVLMVALMIISLVGCDLFGVVGEVTTEESTTERTPDGDVTTAPVPDDTTGEGDVTTTVDDDDQTGGIIPEDTTKAPDDGDETTEPVVAIYHDPLTGLKTVVDVSKVRPVSIVFDNLSAASPQSGISRADILIECMVEGGISRLIGITNKYGADNEFGGLESYGPIRSTRPYMVSLSQAFGSLMVGAGYSPQGYELITKLGADYINGTHDRYALQGFYRDADRFKNSGYEHSLMITGKGILKLAELNKFNLTTDSADAFNFAPEDSPITLAGGSAAHVILKYSAYQQIQMVYSSSTGKYYRYQYGDQPHLDAENGEQLCYENVFVLFANTKNIAGDTEGRLDVSVTGTGDGYYINGGKYTPIKWTRTSDSSMFYFTTDNGVPLFVNRGKTFISVVNANLKDTASVVLNYRLG